MSYKKIVGLFFALGVCLLLLGWGVQTTAAQAETAQLKMAASGCVSCHENLYYLQDMGKSYCLTEAATRCIDCHDGNPDALQKEAAHAGLVKHPIVNGDISRCVNCHQPDAEQHVQKFAALAGYSPVVEIAWQQPPAKQVAAIPVTGTSARSDAAVAFTVVSLLIGSIMTFCAVTNHRCRP